MIKVNIVHISDKVLHDGMAEHVVVPGVMGDFEVVEDHIPIVSLLTRGTVMVWNWNTLEEIPIRQGLMRFDGKELFGVVE